MAARECRAARRESNPTLQARIAAPKLSALEKPHSTPDAGAPDAGCEEAVTCALSTVAAGTVVCIKQLAVQPDVLNRLREMGLGEEQRVRLVSRHPSLICQVCNARVALSQKLAEAILVAPVTKTT
jgi:Fe2+ transport system protein FeoA